MLSHTVRTDVSAILDALVNAYTEKQPQQAVSLFTDDAIFVGTGADEERFGRDAIHVQIERDLAQADAISVRYADLRVIEGEEAASCFARVTIEATVAGERITMPMRLTAVVRPDGGPWRISQAHFSVPAGGQAVGDSFSRPPARRPVIDRFRQALGSGDHSRLTEVYSPDAVFDVNLPEWRFSLVGPDRIAGQLDAWHPEAPNVVEWDERPTGWGAIVELALWEGPGHELYSRSTHTFDVSGDRIVRHVMYCTGDWDPATTARYRGMQEAQPVERRP